MKATDDYLIIAIAVLMAYIAGDVPASPLRDKLERAIEQAFDAMNPIVVDVEP